MKKELDLTEFFSKFSEEFKSIQKKSFKKYQTITSYIRKRNQICILISGEADLVRYDLNGGKSIIEHFSKNDIFGDAFYSVTVNNELLVEAKKNCEVLFFSYEDIYEKDNKNNFSESMIRQFDEILINKIINLNTRIEILTKRSIRDKLLGYFSILSMRSLSKTFELSFSFTDLADFLSVDRSAMMREIKNLVDEGFIKKEREKNYFNYKLIKYKFIFE